MRGMEELERVQIRVDPDVDTDNMSEGNRTI